MTGGSAFSKRRRFEVPARPTASSIRNFKSKSGTRIMTLLVPFGFRTSCQTAPRFITNFENRALVAPIVTAEKAAAPERLGPRLPRLECPAAVAFISLLANARLGAIPCVAPNIGPLAPHSGARRVRLRRGIVLIVSGVAVRLAACAAIGPIAAAAILVVAIGLFSGVAV